MLSADNSFISFTSYSYALLSEKESGFVMKLFVILYNRKHDVIWYEIDKGCLTLKRTYMYTNEAYWNKLIAIS